MKLWQHECMRVFHDRLVDQDDRNWFKTLLVETITTVFSNQATKVPLSFSFPSHAIFIFFAVAT